ncbi:hypothetical protein V6N11_065004 [Hibiscus sabdariffa]|uniref:Uncharacterized protein n=1 Tax=Hibiscus sabdariffa TaxID=183260 RepID=A0ABR2SIN6_9ROSI
MVLGTQGVSQLSSDIPELDVEIRDDDVTVSSLDGTPLINFSKRLHSLINANLSNSVVVRLLGRPIGDTNARNTAMGVEGDVVADLNVGVVVIWNGQSRPIAEESNRFDIVNIVMQGKNGGRWEGKGSEGFGLRLLAKENKKGASTIWVEKEVHHIFGTDGIHQYAAEK